MMGKKEKKEARTKQVQVVVPQHLADAVRLRASSEGVSINQYANNAITSYIESGGDDIVADSNCRIVMMMQPSRYKLLSELAKAQGLSTTQSINHALINATTGKKTDNMQYKMTTYMVDLSHVRAQLSTIVSETKMACNDMQNIIETIKKSKDKKTNNEIQELSDKIITLCNAIDKIYAEESPSVTETRRVLDYEPKSLQ